jgi:hypothetical protein
MSTGMTPSMNGTPEAAQGPAAAASAGVSATQTRFSFGVEAPPVISNVSNGQPLRLNELCKYVFDLTSGWPQRVAGSLAVPVWDATFGRWRVQYLCKPASLIAWLDRFGRVDWNRQSGAPEKSEFLEALLQQAPRSEWATEYFHFPIPTGVLYVNSSPTPRSTGALDRLLAFFRPFTPADRVLLKAFFLTLFWGGPPGKRPLFVFSTGGAAADAEAGRGAGKSTVVHVGGALCGGYLTLARQQDRDRLLSDLLSPHGLGIRLVVMDNIKALKFSSEDIEQLITATVIDGHAMYVGHDARPNYVTYCMTANEPCLSSDLASRCIPVELGRAPKSAAWDEELGRLLGDRAFIEELNADIAWHLSRPTEGYTDDPNDRWAMWWKCVGYPACGSPDVLRHVREVVRERRGEVDGDRVGREAAADAVRDLLRGRAIADPDGIAAFLTATDLIPVVRAVVGRDVPVAEVGKWLGTLAVEHLYKEKNGPAPSGRPRPRGYWWVGPRCGPAGPAFALRPAGGDGTALERLRDPEAARIILKFRPAIGAHSAG